MSSALPESFQQAKGPPSKTAAKEEAILGSGTVPELLR